MTVRFVIECSGNHGGLLTNCRRLIYDAKLLRPEMIKFQCYQPHHLAAKRKNNKEVAAAVGMTKASADELQVKLLHLYMRTFTPREWWSDILDELRGYPFSCSVFSLDDLEFMEGLRCESYKVASFELRDLELIKACASTKKPLTMSVNSSATEVEVRAALNAATGSSWITMLHASNYANKSTMEHDDLQREKNRYCWLCSIVPSYISVGLSDHSPPNESFLSEFAIEKDTDMIERHLRLSDVSTPDSAFSSTSKQFTKYIKKANRRARDMHKLGAANASRD